MQTIGSIPEGCYDSGIDLSLIGFIGISAEQKISLSEHA